MSVVSAQARTASLLQFAESSGDETLDRLIPILLSCTTREQGDFTRAEALATESLEIRRAIYDPYGIAESRAALAVVVRRGHDQARAQTLLSESLALRPAIGDRAGIAECERELGVPGPAVVTS
jgi:hypothetical protein